MSPFPDQAELRSLIDALCEDAITPPQLRRLEEIILSRPEAEAYYVQAMGLYADLVQQLSAAPPLAERVLARLGADPERAATPAMQTGVLQKPGFAQQSEFSPQSQRGRGKLWTAAAVTAVLAGMVLAVARPWVNDGQPTAGDTAQVVDDQTGPQGNQTSQPQPAEEVLVVQPQSEVVLPDEVEVTDNTIAVLLATPGAEWEQSDMPTEPGSPLPPGRMRLRAGFAHIEFYSGATVVFEGPAEFELISSMEAYCSRGKLRASVPPHAQGFTIGSPRLDLVDLGTEFGLTVEGDAATEVHVFEGRVELYNSSDPIGSDPERELTTGQAVRVNPPEAATPIETDPDRFLSAEELAVRSDAEARRRHRDWVESSEAVRRDASLVVYYSFQPEESWSRTLPNLVRRDRPEQDGTIVGCNWVAGRWPGKTALEFKQVSDRVRLHVPGEFDAMTVALWARVDALPNRFNSLFMTDSWDDAEGHWHIARDGTLELGVQGPNRKDFVHYLAPQTLVPGLLGEWVHLAYVYDRPNRQVLHYVNGAAIENLPITLDVPLRIGDAEIGNWDITTRQHTNPVRFFMGRMDEFSLFARALTADELSELYVQGRP